MSKDQGEGEERGFRVQDRRRFDAQGEERDGVLDASEGGASKPTAELADIDFTTFILSLVSSAMVHLGEAPHPEGATRKDLALAKQTIDILGMLSEKTKGNLTEQEAHLMEEVLYDLRLRYVGVSR